MSLQLSQVFPYVITYFLLLQECFWCIYCYTILYKIRVVSPKCIFLAMLASYEEQYKRKAILINIIYLFIVVALNCIP